MATPATASNIQLLHGDCLDLMPSIESGSVDLILADLPYGKTACKWDILIPLAPLWKEYGRVLKRNGAIVLTSKQPFTTLLIASNMRRFRYMWVWEKKYGTGHLDAKKRPLQAHEDVLVFYRRQPTYNPQKVEGVPNHTRRPKQRTEPIGIHRGIYHETLSDVSGMKYPRTVLRFDEPHASVKQHPNQKPVDLMEYLIKTYTNEGETVLDNTMGVGSTLVGCANAGRAGIGIEKDPRYFEIARERVAKALAGPRQIELELVG